MHHVPGRNGIDSACPEQVVLLPPDLGQGPGSCKGQAGPREPRPESPREHEGLLSQGESGAGGDAEAEEGDPGPKAGPDSGRGSIGDPRQSEPHGYAHCDEIAQPVPAEPPDGLSSGVSGVSTITPYTMLDTDRASGVQSVSKVPVGKPNVPFTSDIPPNSQRPLEQPKIGAYVSHPPPWQGPGTLGSTGSQRGGGSGQGDSQGQEGRGSDSEPPACQASSPGKAGDLLPPPEVVTKRRGINDKRTSQHDSGFGSGSGSEVVEIPGEVTA